jgi:outer membrane receptor for ferrienterochelin and colicin
VNNNSDYQVKSTLNDFAFKQEWEWYAGPHTIKWGVNSVYHVIQPAKLVAGAGSGLNDTSYEARYGWENAIFAGDDWKVTDQFTVSYGIRLTDFRVYGPGNFYQVDAAGNVTDTMHYRNGQAVVNYLNPEPRLGLGYQIDSRSSVKASYTRNVQNMHLLANSPISLPADRWDLTNNNIKPEISDQLSVGYYREADDGVYSWSIETYYKTMQHQIDYRTGANIELTDIVETELLYGKGRAYGVEGQLKKNKGKLTGWISYTLSRSELQVNGINDNHWYDAPQDRTHNIAIVGIYHPNDKWTFSADWIYYTGNPVSYPSGKYQADGRIVFYYAERNGYRMPPYDRLDLSVTRHIKKKHNQRELSFGVYNAYDRLNAFVINFRQDPNNPDQTQAVKTALFGIVPYVSYSIKF